MAVVKGVRTGEILPRDYGIELRLPGRRKLLLSPVKYVLAKLMLETPLEVRARLQDKADRDGLSESVDELYYELEKGVKRRHKTKCVLTYDGRDVFEDEKHKTKRYGHEIHSHVKAKSRGREEVKIRFPNKDNAHVGYQLISCECPDTYWDGTKSYDEAMCTHLAALEIALHLDNQSRSPQEDNLTGLLPRERSPVVLPFRFFEGGRGSEVHDQLITNAVWDYYVEGKNMLEINKGLLSVSSLYSAQLVTAFNDQRWQKARFVIVPQKEKVLDPTQLSSTQIRLYAAIKAVEERATRMLWDRGFYRDGFGLEFQGTVHEVVARRFKNRTGRVYSLCIKEGMPPIIVQKDFESERVDLLRTSDYRVDSPFLRLEEYDSFDDSTRKNVDTRVLIPGLSPKSEIRVAQNLQTLYNSLLSA